MKTIYALLLFFLTGLSSSAQHTLHKMWDRRYGGVETEFLCQMYNTPDGGFILGGYSLSGLSGDKTQPSRGDYDYWIVKIDADGNKQWDKRFGGSRGDYLQDPLPTSDGGYILGGSSTSSLNGDKTQSSWGGIDCWLIRIDSLGNKLWDRRYGGTRDDGFATIKQTRDGGFIFTALSTSGISGDKTEDNRDPSLNYADYWVVKIDSAGTKQWDKRFGGSDEDDPLDIIQTPDGGYLVAGTSSSPISGDKTQANARFSDNFWIVKIDSAGTKQWDKVHGGNNGETLKSALNTNDGNYILAGTSFSEISGDVSQGKTGYWIVKVDTSGRKIWDKAWGGSPNMDLENMTKTKDGGYVLTGSTQAGVFGDKTEDNLGSPQAWIVRVDSDGNKLWDKTIFSVLGNFGIKTIQTDDRCYLVALTTSDGIGGYKTQPNWDPGDSLFDYWIVKICDTLLTGISETMGDIHFAVYPNPTAREVSITLQKDGLKEAHFTLTNTSGQIFYQADETHLAPSYTKILDLGALPSGIYLIDIHTDGQHITRKILKQ